MNKTLKDHPFFQAVEFASKIEKKVGQWGAGNARKNLFMRALKSAHPFVFDRRVTHEKRIQGRGFANNFEDLVKDFSLPFKTSLYLMTDSPTIVCPRQEGSKETHAVTLLGYLIQEQTKLNASGQRVEDPENFIVFEVANIEDKGMTVPCINQFGIDLKSIDFALRSAEALGFEIFNAKTEAHLLKETSSVMSFTDCISVKRIGIERVKNFTMKSRGIDAGITVVKYDNLIHIADKVEYEYTRPLEDQNINWDYIGFWRGHWRALYFSNDITDAFGRRVVDYTRIGKNRIGEYVVPGYTWVTEHMRGDPALAEMKTRTVKAE